MNATMRILHIADEDPAQAGAGGLSIRTREINRRLSSRHDITVVVPGYPGAKERVEDGIRWTPIGPPIGRKPARLTQLALLGPHIISRPHDLVVDDFAVPFGAGFAPLYTRKPVVASVQWLFAAEMRDKYRLPFDRIEQWGLRLYDHFIAVSGWLAEQIRVRRPGAVVETIPNAVEDLAFSVEPMPPTHLLFVGRIDVIQKGVDLLLDAMARIRAALGEDTPPLLIVGDGPDQGVVEQQAQQLGLGSLVRFLGRVQGLEKYRLVASAYAVLMPSRFETFGLVAMESLAAGAPLVAFDVGPLQEVAGGGGARLVEPFDVDAFAAAVVELVDHPGLADQLRRAGRSWARKHESWDEMAVRQEQFYLRAIANKSLAGAQSR